jgi:hypothetical protein
VLWWLWWSLNLVLWHVKIQFRLMEVVILLLKRFLNFFVLLCWLDCLAVCVCLQCAAQWTLWYIMVSADIAPFWWSGYLLSDLHWRHDACWRFQHTAVPKICFFW